MKRPNLFPVDLKPDEAYSPEPRPPLNTSMSHSVALGNMFITMNLGTIVYLEGNPHTIYTIYKLNFVTRLYKSSV